MGLSLVAVFAIIATLGLLSLNQAAPVQAESTDGSVTVGTVTVPGNPQEQSDDTYRGGGALELNIEFDAPGDLYDDDKIVVNLGKDFNQERTTYALNTNLNVGHDVNDDGEVATGEFYSSNEVSITLASTSSEESITIEFDTGTENDPTVESGQKVRIMFVYDEDVQTNNTNVTVPTKEGDYTISVGIDYGNDRRGVVPNVTTETITVLNQIQNVYAELMDDIEDDNNGNEDDYLLEDAITQVRVGFVLPIGQGGLSVGDTITVALNDFQGLDTLTMDNILIANANRMGQDNTVSANDSQTVSSVSVSGEEVTVMVPDMDTGNLDSDGIPASNAGSDESPGTSDDVISYVTIVFLHAAGIMNPAHGGVAVVEASTSKHSKAMKTNNFDCMYPTTGTPRNVADDADVSGKASCGTMYLPGAAQTAVALMLSANGYAPNDGPVITPTTPDVTNVIPNSATAYSQTGITVRFRTDATLAADDTITLTFPEGFMLPDIIDPEDTVHINGPQASTVFSDPDARIIEITLPEEIDVRGTEVMVPAGNLIDDQEGETINVGKVSDAGAAVILSIAESAGIRVPMLPADSEGMDYEIMLMTNKEPMMGMGTISISPSDVTGTPPGGVMVSLDPDTAGSNSKLTVRFMTGAEGMLDENDEITVMLPNFGVPASIENADVTVNGASPKSVAANMDTGEIILTLNAAIPENRTVSVVFSMTAGITNPPKAGTVDVSVSTTAESMPAPMKVAIMDPPPTREVRAIEVVPQVPGEDSRITLKLRTPMQLSSVQSSEVIFRFHEDFKIEGGRIDVSKVTIQADSIDGGEVDTPRPAAWYTPRRPR